MLLLLLLLDVDPLLLQPQLLVVDAVAVGRDGDGQST